MWSFNSTCQTWLKLLTSEEWWVNRELDDKTINWNKTFYHPSPIWSIISLTFVTLVMFDILCGLKLHTQREEICICYVSKYCIVILHLFATLSFFALICYTVLFWCTRYTRLRLLSSVDSKQPVKQKQRWCIEALICSEWTLCCSLTGINCKWP